MREYFHTAANVNWHCYNEHFTVEKFIRANCEYPEIVIVRLKRLS